ncbi:hypothetical protein EYF80_027677 [Liparis tanakae]|uniref:Uncharacterized protein n=1 Tax=Liparis tanakae TaxID=230148 RepID=A0A4Z2H9Z7_9TELE|nr:hypothetical protein EYF80_027677 [Liparis tanakae]
MGRVMMKCSVSLFLSSIWVFLSFAVSTLTSETHTSRWVSLCCLPDGAHHQLYESTLLPKEEDQHADEIPVGAAPPSALRQRLFGQWELSGSNGHRSVGGVDQVVHVLTVLIGQGVFTAPAVENKEERSSSSLSLARLPAILFLSASYCRCVLSWWMLRFSATFTSAVISFIAGRRQRRPLGRLVQLRRARNIAGPPRDRSGAGVLTCQRGGVSEGSHLGVRQPGEEGDHRVHHVLVVDDAVLALADQDADELAEVVAELLPQGPRHGEGVVAAVLWAGTRERFRREDYRQNISLE